MPLNEETKEKIRNVFLRKFDDLPVAKDLPRLAKFTIVCDEDGKALPYKEYQKINNEKYLVNGALPVEIKVFLHIRRVLLSLKTALEGDEQAIELDKVLMEHIGDENFFLPEVLTKFMVTHLGGDESKIIKSLKCANQAAIAPPLIELKFALGAENTTKDVGNSWRIIILITDEKNIRVINQKKEMCIANRFLLEWEFSVSLQDKMERVEDIYLKILDISFGADCNTKRIGELRNIIKKYSDNDFWNLTQNSKHFLMDEESLSNLPSFSLLPGEILYKYFANVSYIHRQHINPLSTEGSIFLTNYWIYFIETDKRGKTLFSYQIPLSSIVRINKRKEKGEVDIICKDIRAARFVFQGKTYKSFLVNLRNAIPIYFNRIFAISHSRSIQLTRSEVQTSSDAIENNGWRYYNPQNEMRRVRIDLDKWRLSNINHNFQLCDSYPSELIVPKSINDAELLMSAQYRKNGRFPIVTWRHRNGSILSHGSIPNPVPIDSKNMPNLPAKQEDEKVFQSLIRNCIIDHANEERRNSAPSSSLASKRQSRRGFGHFRGRKESGLKKKEDSPFFIIDLCQKTDAGKQMENNQLEELEGVSIGRGSIYYDNFAELKDSYRRMHKLCTTVGNTEDHWLSSIDSTRWLEQIHNVMQNSFQIFDLMTTGCSVFLSCSEDSWDRGCQISSLAQLWMDPFYRTIKGFIILIEKEWVSFGHKFADRSGYFVREDGPEILPIFVQFLDCAWQTLQQFPNHFEFNNNFLVALAESVYSGCYGTFISNNDASRRANLIRLNTESFWTHVPDYHQYKNPFYIRLESTITPSYHQRALILWSSYFLRWYEGEGPFVVQLPRTPYSTCGQDILSPTSQLVLSDKQMLQRYICTLEKASDSIRLELEKQKTQLELMKGHSISFQTNQPIVRQHSLKRSRTKSLPNNNNEENNNGENNNNNGDDNEKVNVRTTWKAGAKLISSKLRKSLVLNREIYLPEQSKSTVSDPTLKDAANNNNNNNLNTSGNSLSNSGQYHNSLSTQSEEESSDDYEFIDEEDDEFYDD